MSTGHPDSPDDPLQPLFAATASDAAPPHREFLAALRERSAAEFSSRMDRKSKDRRAESPALSTQYSVLSTQYSVPRPQSELPSTRDAGASRPSRFALRTLVALAATAAVVMAGFFLSQLARPRAKPVAQMTLGEVMRNLANVQSYHAQSKRAEINENTNLYGRRGDTLRIETTPARYRIATAEGAVEVDEETNVAHRLQASYYSTDLGIVDPLRVWGLWSQDAAEVLPTERRSINGREYFVYLYSCPTIGWTDGAQIETLVDETTGLPFSIRPVDPRGAITIPWDLRFTAFNQPLDPAKLKVPATLTEDGRIGKVTDWQGNIALRPMTSTRWTPVCDKPILRMGDWLRTDFQGANAVTVQLAPQTRLILGPGSLVELTRPDQITLHSGFAEITPAPKADNFGGIVKLTGPAGSTLDVAGAVLVTTSDKGLVTSDKEPVWLAGYKGNAVSESLGSLVATIDGRRVPLTVGYHKVSVEIRDQIARTTIEESFVNHTSGVLEGQFHFPLPADASISGFGMWVGSTLHEADIVEKQRAREIYETILREKRDPGLLEWTGGNIFKARVYPIPANGEKRIKIVYTQVLPKKGDSYRYSYALQSDLLRQNPLRELDLDVTISSTQPLAGVICPTHLTRNQLTEHAARVEFSAQKYTPTRDFEVVVETVGRWAVSMASAGAATPDVVFIPHQRGEDGYFLLQLQPPSDAPWQRDILPDGEPLRLLVLADTSASMDAASRRVQGEVLAALVGSLSPKDTFNVAACDVDCTWTFEKPEAADEKSIAKARESLARRRSMGWTNLDRACESAAKQIEQGTQVVYLGDGIVTTGDMDGPAFVNRLGQLLGGRGATLHAIAVSSSHDAAVLRGMANIGGGSLRQVSGEIGPQQVAKDLLAEITRPALKNIELSFSGLRTARVYPRVLPNVPAGTQQIVLGRYLPSPGEQSGEIIATGTLDGKPTTYRTTFTIPSTQYSVPSTQTVSAANPKSQILNPKSDSDASFIPRLWARMHLDELLAQGTSQQVQDEIINLSEEFHIITPYTSLLVLESDADRERFKVKRRFQMRDGERFFADARDVAQYQLVQQQMQRAGLWRRGLREQVLMSLASLGRERQHLEQVRRDKRHKERVEVEALIDSISNTVMTGSWADAGGPGSIRGFETNLNLVINQTQEFFGDFDRTYGGLPGSGSGNWDGINVNSPDFGFAIPAPTGFSDFLSPADGPALIYDPKPGRPMGGSVVSITDGAEDRAPLLRGGDLAHKAEPFPLNAPIDGTEFSDEKGRKSLHEWAYDSDGESLASLDPFAARGEPNAHGLPMAGELLFAAGETIVGRKLRSSERRLKASYLFDEAIAAGASAAELSRASWPLIPLQLPAARPTGATAGLPSSVQPPSARPKSLWPAEAQELARSLETSVGLTKLTGGLIVREEIRQFDPHHSRLANLTTQVRLVSAKAWLVHTETDGFDPRIDWAEGGERGAASPAYDVSLVRKSEPTDFPATYETSQWWQNEVEWSFQDYTASVEHPQEGQARLVLKHVIRPEREVRLLIDTVKKVVLSVEWLRRGQVESSQRASDFAQVAGVWVPQKIEQLDDQGRVTSSTTRKIRSSPPEEFDGLLKSALAPADSALRVQLPLPKLDEAKDRIAKGQAALEDRLVLLMSLAADQKWPEAHEELARTLALIPGKSFAPWIRIWLLDQSRRLEELRQLVLTQAKSLAGAARPGERTLLDRFQQISSSHFAYEEQLAVLDALKPVYARLPDQVQGPRLWGEIRQGVLQSAARDAEQLAELRELVRTYPAVEYNHRILARRLIDQGEYDAGYEVLRAALARPVVDDGAKRGANWSAGERDRLYEAWADHLKAQGRWAEQRELTAEWLGHHPQDADAYKRYLACLVYTRREAEADQLVGDWLKAGLADSPLAKDVEAKVTAAVETATGDNGYMASGDIDPRFLPAMAKLLVAHAADEDQPRFLYEITSDYDVRRTDAYKAAADKIVARLKAEAGALPLAKLQTLVSWCISYAEQATDDDWKAIAAAIRPRWDVAVKSTDGQPPAGHPAIESLLANSLLQVLGRVGHDEKVAFLRLRLEKSDEPHRAGRASALFEALLESSWSAEIEAESLGLIDKLSSDDDAAGRLRDWIVALYRWTDRMEEAHVAKLVGAIERPDKLTRTELTDKHAKIRQQVRTDLSARLAAAAAARQDGLGAWLTIEHLTLEARLERDLPKVVERCWELIGPTPPANPPPVVDDGAKPLGAMLRARTLAMLIRLAIRKDAPAAEAERLSKYFDAAIAANDGGINAHLAKYVLLVALDQPQPLIEQLAAWSKGDDRPQVWQLALAYLKAELGDLDGAIALAEPLAAADALGAADYRALAGWYQAQKLDQKYHEAQVAAWKQLDEWRLRNVLRAHLAPWENLQGPSPGAIDPQLFLVLEALFAKSSNPSEHVYLVRNFYEKSRDFRLVAALADAVVGQSAGNVYRFLKELDSTFDEIDREATVDELLAQVAKVRDRSKSSVDARALDLLTMLAEQRAAELKNAPGPHVAAAVAALQSATKPEWSPGEPRLFAQMLADLGQITQKTLSDERVRVLQSLHTAAAGLPEDRLAIAHALADSLIDDNRRQDALDVLEPALAEHLAANGGKRTSSALDTLRLYADQIGAAGNFVRAESVYQKELAQVANPQVASEIRLSLYQVHVAAIERSGSTSLGQGLTLYRAVERALRDELERTADQNERRRLVDRLCELYQTAHRHQALGPAVKADVVAFGENGLPALLERQIDNYQETVERVERTIRDTAGYLPALRFLVTRIEGEPAWLARKGDDGWRHFAWELGILHDEVRGKLGDLEPRFLKLVLDALRRELTTHTERRQVIYHQGSTHFWQERTDDFVRVAEEVLAEQRQSPQAILYITNYLYRGIGRHARAIEILLDAHRRGLLDEDGRARLVIWLQERDRFGESIAILEPLMKEHPSSLSYRIQLMRAYFRTNQPEALRKLLTETDKFFHEENRWGEEVAAQLAMSTLENGLDEQAVEYLREAISRREDALNKQTTGDRTLAQYYVDRAYAHAGLANTKAAVDDACSAAVVWGVAGDGLYRRRFTGGSMTSEQVHPLDVLKNVLAASPDLNGYVAELDADVAKSTAERPIVRKSLGEVYFDRREFDKALVQLKLDVELSPGDGAIHAKLVECYDALMQSQAAAEQLFASVELARRDIDLWTKLSERLEKLEQPAEAERARTSLVEMLPTETEGHTKLAEIRQSQGRWDEAIVHWRHVARLRKLEPAGLLGLAAAQIHERERGEADKTLRELETTEWPARFHDELRQKQLPRLREEWRKLP